MAPMILSRRSFVASACCTAASPLFTPVTFAALPGERRFVTIVLRGALGMSDDDISHLRGLTYSKDLADAIDAVESGRADAGFFMRPTPIRQVREVAATGESMPPKSTYFYPKVPTGLVFNPLT